MDLGNKVEMSFFSAFFHYVGIDDLRGAYRDGLELILLSLPLELHG